MIVTVDCIHDNVPSRTNRQRKTYCCCSYEWEVPFNPHILLYCQWLPKEMRLTKLSPRSCNHFCSNDYLCEPLRSSQQTSERNQQYYISPSNGKGNSVYRWEVM